MSLQFADGMAHYEDDFLGAKYDFRNTLNVVQTKDGGRLSGKISFSTIDNGEGAPNQTAQHLQKNYNGGSEIVIGVAVQQDAIQHQDGGWFLHFMGGSTVQLGLKIQQSGQLMLFHSIVAGGGIDPHGQWAEKVTVLGETTNSIQSSAWDHLEIRVVHHATAGIVEIRCNGGDGSDASNAWTETFEELNTAKSGFANSASIIFGGHESAQAVSGKFIRSAFSIADFHIIDTVAGADARDPVTFIGDRNWEEIDTTADGADTAWTVEDGGSGDPGHFQQIDEVPPDTNDYNHSDVVDAQDGFIVSSPTGAPSTAGAIVVLTMYCQKTGGGSNILAGFMRSAGAVYKYGTQFEVPSPWAFRQSFIFSTPAGNMITVADIATHQFGYRKIA